MAEFPALPLWTDAYIADTQHLTNEEHGVYLRLLMFAWRTPTCSLPDDDRRLAIMVGTTPKVWARLKPVVMAFWDLSDGQWTQKKLTCERDFVRAKRKQCSAAGKASAEAKSLKNNNAAPTDVVTGSQREGQREANPHTHTHKERKDYSPKPPKRRLSYPPDFEKFWSEYPTDANMSKKEALLEWGRLDSEDRQSALQSLQGFNAYCRSHTDYRPIHANRYLKHRRFDGHLEASRELRERHQASKVKLLSGTAPYIAWNNYRESRGERPISRSEWWFPSEWPPGHPNSEARQ